MAKPRQAHLPRWLRARSSMSAIRGPLLARRACEKPAPQRGIGGWRDRLWGSGARATHPKCNLAKFQHSRKLPLTRRRWVFRRANASTRALRAHPKIRADLASQGFARTPAHRACSLFLHARCIARRPSRQLSAPIVMHAGRRLRRTDGTRDGSRHRRRHQRAHGCRTPAQRDRTGIEWPTHGVMADVARQTGSRVGRLRGSR